MNMGPLKEDKLVMDFLSLQIIELTDKLIASKCRLENLMKDGYFNLAQSRYVMGSKSVSQLQLPSEDREISAVIRTKRTSGSTQIPETECSYQSDTFGLMNINDEQTITENFLVNRKSGSQVKESRLNKDEKSTDPLRWFGILIPQSLKLAQKNFKCVLDHVADVATLESELNAVVEQYNALLKTK